mmetsp:Transcript_29355/g.53765  ORF Transcript_29355/g.53765 Transcript_29355/m.53765 type:complete len:95 (+) Transcript_29355:2011-2295(+)
MDHLPRRQSNAALLVDFTLPEEDTFGLISKKRNQKASENLVIFSLSKCLSSFERQPILFILRSTTELSLKIKNFLSTVIITIVNLTHMHTYIYY